MNKTSEMLVKEAKVLRESNPELVAVGLLKQAGMKEEDARIAVAQESMEKQACFELTQRGIDPEEALNMIKAANVDLKGISLDSLITDEELLADKLEKAASFIEAQAEVIEAQTKYISELEKAASEASAQSSSQLSEPLSKVASAVPFTIEDLEALRGVPEETITKIASVMEEPWGFGKAAGASKPAASDPFTDFLMS